MHCLSEILVLIASSAIGINAFETSIFTFTDTPDNLRDTSSEHQTVSEDIARLILELRLQSSLASVLGVRATESVEIINHFSDTTSTLFGDFDIHDAPVENIIVIEGIKPEIGSSMRIQRPHSIFVPHSSTSLVSESLESFQVGERGESCIYDNGANGTGLVAAQSAKNCLLNVSILASERSLFNYDILSLINSIETWVSQDRSKTASRISFEMISENDPTITKFVDTLFETLSSVPSHSKHKTTTILIPAVKADSEIFTSVSRRDGTSWTRSSTTNAQKELQRPAQILGLHSNIAPVCHSSNVSCAEATDNCSGHGTCYLKTGSGDEKSSTNCYACRCHQTVVRNDDGTVKKVQWGGSACQKKDITSPFFLISGVSVLLVVVASSAIGLLFNMGQLDLPSVIGAGVGGLKTQS